jgi:hypothetical protein
MTKKLVVGLLSAFVAYGRSAKPAPGWFAPMTIRSRRWQS